MTTAVLHATCVRLPAFTPAVHAAFRAARIDLFRIPACSAKPTEARLELEATDEYEALAQIRRALHAAGVSPDIELIFEPYPFPGRARWGDGPPE